MNRQNPLCREGNVGFTQGMKKCYKQVKKGNFRGTI